MITALALWGCDGTTEEPLPPGVTFDARDLVCDQGEVPPCETTVPATSAAARTHEVGDEHDNATFVYVVNTLTLPQATGGQAAGFNLDGIDSGDGDLDAEDCSRYMPDFTSSTDPGHVGVDNALEGLVSTLAGLAVPADDPCKGMPDELGCTILEQINAGSLILMLEVSGVDSFRYDNAVKLQLFLGEVPGDGEPVVEGGVLAPNQAFDVVMNLGEPVDGDIFDGRLRATTPRLALVLNIEDMDVPLTITNPEIRADIDADGLTNGGIGGELTIAALQETVDMLGVDFDIEAVAANIADLSPSAADPNKCEGLSVGITFGATSATRN